MAQWKFYIKVQCTWSHNIYFPLAVYYVLNEEDIPVTINGWINGFEYHFHTAFIKDQAGIQLFIKKSIYYTNSRKTFYYYYMRAICKW